MCISNKIGLHFIQLNFFELSENYNNGMIKESIDVDLSLPEIRRITGQENGKISPYLKLMIDKKIINKEAKTLRGGTYSISDPLFKLWLQRFI